MYYKVLDDNYLEIRVDSSLYSSSVLFKCLYWYGDKYECVVSQDEQNWLVTIKLKEGEFNEESVKGFISSFIKNLIDFKTREIISIETKNIRDILLVKAFAFEEEFDEIPPGLVEDPVGFDLNQY